MARKQNPDMKVVLIALAALGGLGAAYYFTRSKSGGASRLTDDAAAGNGGPSLLTNSPAAPASSYTAQSYTPTPTAGSGVVNHATGAPATPKEKQLGLNWLQALIQKNGTKSIYNPFSESDLATGSFGPKSRAALAKANEVMRAAFAALPSSATKNLFVGGVEGDAALQALVDNVTVASPAVAPNAAEIQALVKAAGGTVGASIGAATPSPSAAPAYSPQPTATPRFFLRPLSAGQVRGIQNFCNFVAQTLDDNMIFGTTSGLRTPVTGTLTRDTLRAYRKVLGMFANHFVDSTDDASSRSDAYFPPAGMDQSLARDGDYTQFVALSDGYAARLNLKALNFFNGLAGKKMNRPLQGDLVDAYDEMSKQKWAYTQIPEMELTEAELHRLIPNTEIVNG